jgi:hypothetical protein
MADLQTPPSSPGPMGGESPPLSPPPSKKPDYSDDDDGQPAAAAAAVPVHKPSTATKGRARAMRNLRLHVPILTTLASCDQRQRVELLKNATPELVGALATAARLTKDEQIGAAHHATRHRRMASPNLSWRNRVKLVAGPRSGTSRGGGYYKALSARILEMMPLGSDRQTAVE